MEAIIKHETCLKTRPRSVPPPRPRRTLPGIGCRHW